jgi:hypothetical protein
MPYSILMLCFGKRWSHHDKDATVTPPNRWAELMMGPPAESSRCNYTLHYVSGGTIMIRMPHPALPHPHRWAELQQC